MYSLTQLHNMIPWMQVGEYAVVALVVIGIVVALFNRSWWTTTRVWGFLIIGSALVWYFWDMLSAIYFFLVVMAILYNTIPEKLFGRIPPWL